MLRILYLEDSAKDRELLQGALENRGIKQELFWASSKSLFVTRLDRVPIDVVLCDSGGAKFDETEALELVRNKQPQAVFIFLTGHTSGPILKGLKQSGADAVLSKTELPLIWEAIAKAFRVKGRTLEGL